MASLRATEGEQTVTVITETREDETLDLGGGHRHGEK